MNRAGSARYAVGVSSFLLPPRVILVHLMVPLERLVNNDVSFELNKSGPQYKSSRARVGNRVLDRILAACFMLRIFVHSVFRGALDVFTLRFE